MNGNGGNAYQVLPPDLQAVIAVSSQQATGTSNSPMPMQQAVGSGLASTASQLQQLTAQQQQQQLAAAFAANQQHMLSLGTLPQHLAAAQFGLPSPMGLPGFPQQQLMAQLLAQQNPGHSDMSHITLPLEQLKQSVKQEPVSRSIQRSRSETGASSAYASRHQAAEQRRRTRINERCVWWRSRFS